MSQALSAPAAPAAGGLVLETLTTAAGLAAAAPGWDELVRGMPRPSPFLLHGWLCEWWSHYGDTRTLAVHVARRGGELVGLLPLCVRGGRGLRTAEFLGAGHSHLADLVLAAREGPETAAALVERASRSAIDLVDVFGLPGSSRLAAAAGGRLQTLERVEAPVLELPEGWEAAYREKTSAKTRNGHKRKWAKLAELGDLQVRQVRTWEQMAPVLEEGLRLHALRWDGLRDISGLTEERGRAFQRAGYRALAQADVARLVVLELDGRAVAFNAYLELGGSLYSHRLSYDPELARYSPGLLCTLRTAELAAADGVRRVEWLGGTEDYKLQLMDRFEPLYQGLGLARTPQGRAAVAVRLGTIAARRRLKHSPALRRLVNEQLPAFRRRLRG